MFTILCELVKSVVIRDDEEFRTVKLVHRESLLLKKENGEKMKYLPHMVSRVEISLSKRALDVLDALLTLVANGIRVVTYDELSEMTKYKPSADRLLPWNLREIRYFCDGLGFPDISSMVVDKTTGLPGDGFQFRFQKYDNYRNLSEEEILDSELNRIAQCDSWDLLAQIMHIEKTTQDKDVN